MPTTTPNHGLKKPLDADNADLKVFVGDNMDIIDTELAKRVAKDSLGTTTNPTNSSFRATASGTQSMTASSIIKLLFQNVEYDTQSEYDTATSTFTAKSAGVYMISACMRVGNTATQTQLFLSVYKNGAEYTRLQNYVNGTPATAQAYQAHGCAIVKLNAGDTITMYGYTTQTLTLQNNAGATFFSAVKIG